MDKVYFYKGFIPVEIINDFGNGELRCKEISGNAFFCRAEELSHDTKYDK